jgi:hypothetical protein
MVIATDMEHLIAAPLVPRVANAGSAMAHLVEVGELLGVEMEEITWGLMLIPIVRFFLDKRGRQGSTGLPEPKAYGRAGHAKLPGNPDRRLALPSSTYGLDDEPKLMASRQAVGLAGAILEARLSLSPKALDPLVPSTLAEPSHGGGSDDRHPGKNPFHK